MPSAMVAPAQVDLEIMSLAARSSAMTPSAQMVALRDLLTAIRKVSSVTVGTWKSNGEAKKMLTITGRVHDRSWDPTVLVGELELVFQSFAKPYATATHSIDTFRTCTILRFVITREGRYATGEVIFNR